MNFVWQSWSEFANMGGYGLYVWGSFGVTGLVLAWEVAALALRRRALARDIDDPAAEGSAIES